MGPETAIVMRTRCLRLSIAVHITSNVIGAVLVLVSLVGRDP